MVWIRQFLFFLRKVRRFPRRRSVTILESYYGDRVAVLRLQDSGIPGAVDLWRIDRHYERLKFFVCVVNVSALRQDLRLAQRRAISGSIGGSRLAECLADSLRAQRHVGATHFWLTGWDVEFSGIDAQGRHYRSTRLDNLAILAVDLQGAAGPFAGDRYALRYSRKIIVALAANDFPEYSRHQTWARAVKAIDWASWLEQMARAKQGGIAPDHILQPKHARVAVRPPEGEL